ncbi:helix-turn-helix transcriptional regulator [Streptomyces chiangmaiensis]|uniref:helix-turn-helix domain-containing protein n=1 Tax=Streptomyces chiangmaiensis TaxID=766497 RepID=UPI0031E80C4E
MPLTCKQCGKPRHLQATDRPCDYCSTPCHQAAHRQRQAVATPPGTEELDQAIRFRLQEITRVARAILLAVGQPDTLAEEFLATMVHLQATSERLTPDMVARTRLRGASWEQIAAPLGMSKEAARKKWSSPGLAPAHQLPNRPAIPPGNNATVCHSPDGTDAGCASLAPRGVTSAAFGTLTKTVVGQDLATVLNSLQRASGLSLRPLASRCDLSPGFLFRLLTGERFPAWKNVAAIARACGADSDVLRRVWEASAARRDSPLRPASLTTALRFLHQRVGSPTPWAIATTSGNTLDQDHVAGLLAGTATAPWENVERLIQVLDGEPPFFFPLWQAQASGHAAPPPLPATPAREHSSAPGHCIEEFLTAFSSAHGPSTIARPLVQLQTGGDDGAGARYVATGPAVPDRADGVGHRAAPALGAL